MKKLFWGLFLILVIPGKALAVESAIVMDGYSNRVLMGINENKPKLIASTTKIMTALVALENGNLDEKIKVDESVLKAYGSAIYIEVGEKISLRDLLYGLMLRSGNDAALVIAQNVAKNEKEFVKLMNQKAQDIGMKNTIFYNSHGLEEKNGNGNTSTAYDMALLMQEAMKNKDFQKITSTKNYTTKTNKKTYTWKNKNKLLFNYKYTTGGKTGFTEKARRTLVTSATKNNKKLIIVTLNDSNDFTNHQKWYEQYFKEYNVYKIIDKNKYQITNEHYKNKILYLKEDVKLMLTKEEKKNIKINLNIDEEKNNNSKIVGKLVVLLNDQEITSQNIYVKDKKVKKKNKFFSWFS